jgi:hypothetical protein
MNNPRKFDVVVQNPPYQIQKNRQDKSKTGMCGSTLWDKFILNSINISNKNGIIISINPSQWRSPKSDLFNLIKSKNLVRLEIYSMSDGLKTFGVQTGYDVLYIQNKPYEGKTIIIDSKKIKNEVNIGNFDFIPNHSIGIIKNLLYNKEKCELIYSRSAYGTDKFNMSKEKTDTHIYPCIYGITKKDGLKIWYSNINSNGHFKIPKVIIPASKYTDAYYDKNGEYGLCQFVFGIPVENDEDGELLVNALKEGKFKDFFDATEWIYNTKNYKVINLLKKNWWKSFL